MSNPRFTNKVALVSGGASGIGAAVVRALAAEGARVAVLDLAASKGAEMAKEVGGVFVGCDVTEPSQWKAALDRVVADLGGLDLVHLNAGIMTRPPQTPIATDILEEDIDTGAYRRIMSINIDGVIYGMRAVLPVLAKRGGGAIVATASVAGLLGFPPDPFYTMTKHAVVGMVRSFAPLLMARNVRLNAVCPGGVDTPLVPEQFRGNLSPLSLMPAAHIAAVVLDLFASPASGELWVKAGAESAAYRYDVPAVVMG